MRTLGIIPARAGSRRLPGKNWRPLGGRPLVDYALATATAATRLTAVAVSTDSEEVLAVARRYPTVHRILRPAALSTDTAPAIAYVHHALAEMRAAGHPPFAAVAIIQPTSPFTLPADVDATLSLLVASGADSAVSVVAVPHDLHPLKFKTLAADGRLRPFGAEEAGRMAAHELPETFVRNGSVYASTAATIAAGGIIGPDCRGYRMPRSRSVDLNDAHDWAFAEFLLHRAVPPASTT